MRTIALGSVLLLTACGNNQGPTLVRTTVWNLFPFDGQRTWDFVNESNEAPYRLMGSIVGDPDIVGRRSVYAVSYVKECRFQGEDCVDGDEVLNLRWSSDPSDGVLLHGFTTDGFFSRLRPPVMLTSDTAQRNEVFTTTSGELEWSSTFLGIQDCPVTFTNEWQCGVFELSTNAEEPVPVEGTIWAVRGHGIVGMELAGDYGLWRLANDGCTGECDGEW